MKCVIFLAICVAAVVGLPFDYERDATVVRFPWEYGQDATVVGLPWEYGQDAAVVGLPFEYERDATVVRRRPLPPWERFGQSSSDTEELASIWGRISISVKDKDGTWKRIFRFGDKDKKAGDKKVEDKKAGDKKTEVASLPEADVAKWKIKAHGNLNVGIKFSNLEEAYSQDEAAVWINTGDGKNDVRIGGFVQLEAEQVGKAVQKELAKLGIKEEINAMEILEPVQMEDIKILSSSENIADLSPAELAKMRINGKVNIKINFANPVALEGAENVDAANVPTAESAKFKIKMHGKINVGIKFSNPITTETALAELAHEEGAVCIHVGNEGEGVHYGGIVKAEGMSAVKIDDIQMVPAAELAKSEINIETDGKRIKIGGKITW